MGKKRPAFNKVTSSSNPDRPLPNAPGHFRTKDTIKRLKMYTDKPNKKTFYERPTTAKRIEPNKKWFTNTRSVDQNKLEQFREAMQNHMEDPTKIILNRQQLPMSLLRDPASTPTMNLLTTETFQDTFGPKSKRKKPKLASYDCAGLLASAQTKKESYVEEKDPELAKAVTEDFKIAAKEQVLLKGQSTRIWAELYKVLDSSDVVIQVLDARDPIGTRSLYVEQHLKKNARHKHLVLLLNKCDLIPTWATARWVRVLSREYPTLAFHASITNSFGKGALIQLLRQFGQLHSDKKNISVGFIGYPNVGKSSVINTLRKKNVCRVAPIPGETKVWQYITLTRKIYLIDSPGVVYDTGDSDTAVVLKGVVRAERLEDPTEHISEVLERVKPIYMDRTYGVGEWKDAEDFLTKMAEKTGRLLKGAEPDMKTVARTILFDWQRGKIPFFVPPPFDDNTTVPRVKHEVPSVKQPFKAIVVAADFTDQDQHAHPEVFDAKDEEEEEAMIEDLGEDVDPDEDGEEADKKDGDEGEEEEEEEPQVDWDAVYKKFGEDTLEPETYELEKMDEDDDDAEEEEEEEERAARLDGEPDKSITAVNG
eukprot:GILJ01004345.1.p2 GENE.GILJ01004345.1~~GILJ01004345.1.p2  ORF type:complete len:593 (-),score=131.09 GILJ01004345.1:2276-4054(-)